MVFDQFRFVYVNTDYLRALNEADSEVLFVENDNYENKPHLGILINCNGYHYVMPLTSAKEKHKKWRDVTQTNYRIYEIIDIRTAKTDKYDIIVSENDYNKLRSMGVEVSDFDYFKKRILSVLEIKKMFPVPKNMYTVIDLDTPSNNADTEQRRILMRKEYFFCRKFMRAIEDKANALYNKQITTGEIQPFCCNYRKLETIADAYNVIKSAQ